MNLKDRKIKLDDKEKDLTKEEKELSEELKTAENCIMRQMNDFQNQSRIRIVNMQMLLRLYMKQPKKNTR